MTSFWRYAAATVYMLCSDEQGGQWQVSGGTLLLLLQCTGFVVINNRSMTSFWRYAAVAAAVYMRCSDQQGGQ